MKTKNYHIDKKGYMKCNICNTKHHVNSGNFYKHIKNEHNIISKTEYYYMFNKIDMCIICGKKKREILNWKFKQSYTCCNHACKKLYGRNKSSLAQIAKSKEGTHNFQINTLNTIKRNKQLFKEGKHPFQNKELRKRLRHLCIDRNNTNNPMKDPVIAKKMSESSKGKILSDSHKKAISIGLKKYLNKLSDIEFKKRMDNTQTLNIDINKRLIIADKDNDYRGINKVLTEKEIFNKK